MNYYPLAAQNEWQYKQKDGSTYVNKVTAYNNNEYTMHNTAANTSSTVRTDGNTIITDALEAGNFTQWLKNDLQEGDQWEIFFKANGLVCILVMHVKGKGISKEVEGRNYNDVLFIEAESKMIINGNVMPLNFFTQYFYANDIGLILTTSSAGDMHALTAYDLN